ncbi:hypothetical protein CRUP_027398 [Coryphaenoides rupestris]|nr:hypothetical protein CRUP_027398 [Coryphaenoides rupestris]
MSDPSDLWECQTCHQPFLTRCPAHGPTLFIPDTPVAPGSASRAALSAPSGLRVVREEGEVEVRCGGHSIPQGAVFGPYEGELLSKENSSSYSWIIVGVNNTYQSIDGSDDTKANWMRYVRISSAEAERNLTAFQRGTWLYFSASRQLLPGDRLRVWYGDDYIARLHSLSELSIDCNLHTDDEPPPSAAHKTKSDSTCRDGVKALPPSPPPLRLCKRRRLSGEGVDLRPVKVEEVVQEEQASTSSCPNCVKLRLRIHQLEAELHQLRGQRSDPNPEQGPIEDLCGKVVTF